MKTREPGSKMKKCRERGCSRKVRSPGFLHCWEHRDKPSQGKKGKGPKRRRKLTVPLHTRLWSTAESAATSHGFDISGDATDLIREFINHGVQRMLRDGVAEDEEMINLAQSNLNRFIERMAARATAVRATELQPAAFEAALRLCPIWPFC